MGKKEKDQDKPVDDYVTRKVNSKRRKVERKGEYKGESHYAKQGNHDRYKDKQFEEKDTIKDIYGNDVCRTKEEAKKKYGKDYAKHVASVEHVTSCKQIVDATRYNPFLSSDDVIEIVNNEKNYVITSLADNQSKGGDKSCSEVAKEKQLSEKEKAEIKKKEKEAQKAIRKDIAQRSAKNAGKMVAEGVKSTAPTLTADTALEAVSRISEGDSVEEVIVDASKNMIRGVRDSAEATLAQPVIETTIIYAKDKAKNETAKKILEKIDERAAAGTIYSAIKDSAYLIKTAVEEGEVTERDVTALAKNHLRGIVRVKTEQYVKQVVTREIQKVATKITQKIGGKIGAKLGSVIGSAAGPLGTAIGYFAGYLASALVGVALSAILDCEREVSINEIISENMTRYYEKMSYSLEVIHEEHRRIIIESFLIIREGIYQCDDQIFDLGLKNICLEFGFDGVVLSQEEFNELMADETHVFQLGYVKKKH